MEPLPAPIPSALPLWQSQLHSKLSWDGKFAVPMEMLWCCCQWATPYFETGTQQGQGSGTQVVPHWITSALGRLPGMSSLWILLHLISSDNQALASCRGCHAELSKERKLDTNTRNCTGSIQCSMGKKHLHQWLISITGGEQFPDIPFYGHFQSVPLESQSMWVM